MRARRMSLILPPSRWIQSIPTISLAATRRYIVEQCAEGFRTYVVDDHSNPGARVFVKRGNSNLVEEARTQAYIFKHTSQLNVNTPNVPEVYDVFTDEECGDTYLVMEYVSAPSFRAWIEDSHLSDVDRDTRTSRTERAATLIADTVSWLLRCPLPEGGLIGPVGGGRIQHIFFAMHEAAIPFVNSAALERYLNKALSFQPEGSESEDRIDLADEPLILCHSDITFNNFLWDPVSERVWMVDFGHVGVLPQSFFSYIIHSIPPTSHPLIKAMNERIDLPVSSQLKLLQQAALIILQNENTSFGLDARGYPSQLEQEVQAR